MSYQSAMTSANFVQSLPRSKRWTMKLLMRLNARVLRWLDMPRIKSAPTASPEPLDKPLSIALQAALKFPAPRRLASSLMDSRLSVSLVEDQLKTSGQVTNSDLIVIVSSHDAPHARGEEILAISSIQHFAKFSLN